MCEYIGEIMHVTALAVGLVTAMTVEISAWLPDNEDRHHACY